MWLALYAIYPHYQYYIDPDGTAYLTISQRYATGDFQKAINGYWSPWSCWLTALLIRAGIAAIPASIIINSLGATGFLYISQWFFTKYGVARVLQWALNIALAIFLCYAIFWQSFDDLWECFFLLSALRLLLGADFLRKPSHWVAYAALGALAYFAKAYALPFIVLNSVCLGWFIIPDRKLLLRICAIVFSILLLLAAPWVCLLHQKYGIWTTSTAGSLNTSWYLVGHPYWKDGIGALLPPAYPDSPYYWEDPWFANGITPHFWNTMQLFIRQLLRIGFNSWKLVQSLFQLSFLYPYIALYFIITRYKSVRTKKENREPSDGQNEVPLAITLMLFPLGYLLVNFEPRYLWYMLPLGITLGALQLQRATSVTLRKITTMLLPLSIVVFPLVGLKQMYNVGTADYHTALRLKELNIHGTFTALASPGASTQSLERIAYFSGMSFYTIPLPATKAQVLEEIRRYRINYYFNLSPDLLSPQHPLDHITSDENGHPFPEISQDKLEGLKIFEVTK